jgi:hypothetical protein
VKSQNRLSEERSETVGATEGFGLGQPIRKVLGALDLLSPLVLKASLIGMASASLRNDFMRFELFCAHGILLKKDTDPVIGIVSRAQAGQKK